MLNKKPIKIGILEASPQTKAILEFFFSSSGKAIFKESNIKDASAFIIDYDYPGSKERWEKISSETSKPGIIISIKKVEIESTFWVPKPLNSKDLIETGKKIKELLQEAEEEQLAQNPQPLTIEKTIIVKEKPEEIKAEVTEKEIDSKIKAKTKEKPLYIQKPVKQKAKAELALTDTDDSQLSSLDVSESDSFEDFSLEERTQSDSKNTANPAETINLMDDFSPITDDTTKSEKATELPEENFTTSSELELTASIPDSTEFAIAPTLIEVSNNLDGATPSDEPILNNKKLNLSTHQEESPTPKKQSSEEEGDIDALLHTLISGETGKRKNTSAELPTFESLSEGEPQDALTPTSNAIEENEFNIVLSTVDNDKSLENIETEPEFLEFTVDDAVSTSESENSDLNILETAPSIDEFIETSPNEELIDLDLGSLLDEKAVNSPLVAATNEEPADLLFEISPEEEIIDLTLEPSSNEETIELSLDDLSEDTVKDLSIEFPSNKNKLELSEPSSNEEPTNLALNTPFKEEENDLIEVDNLSFNPEEEVPFIKSEGSSADFESVRLTPEEELKSAEDELQSLLDEIRGEAEEAAIKKETAENEPSKQDLITAEARWNLLCGNNATITKPKEAKKITFDPNDYMISALLNVCEQSRYADQIMRLKIKDQLYVVDYNRDFIYHNNSIFGARYAENCHKTIDPTELKIHNLDISEQRLYLQKVVNEPNLCHNIDFFIWTTSLLTSQGRLPTGVDINKTVSLKSWPNLTRLEQIPNDMQIAATFYKHPGSLMEICSWLKIDQRYIFAFYNASLSLDLIEFDEQKIRSASSNAKGASKKTKNRGFFSRLLKRLKS